MTAAGAGWGYVSIFSHFQMHGIMICLRMSLDLYLPTPLSRQGLPRIASLKDCKQSSGWFAYPISNCQAKASFSSQPTHSIPLGSFLVNYILH